jgi:hypothetical protein
MKFKSQARQNVFGKLLLELEYAEIGGLVVDSDFRRQGIADVRFSVTLIPLPMVIVRSC